MPTSIALQLQVPSRVSCHIALKIIHLPPLQRVNNKFIGLVEKSARVMCFTNVIGSKACLLSGMIR